MSSVQETFTRRVVTSITITIAGLTFVFSFGTIWALGRRLDVTHWLAPLVGPTVDLSCVGLVVGRHFLV